MMQLQPSYSTQLPHRQESVQDPAKGKKDTTDSTDPGRAVFKKILSFQYFFLSARFPVHRES
jgi:hypothetical protein